MAEWSDGYWWSKDGLRLHYRDYAGGADGRPPILCIPGLTRNVRDFAPMADRLAGEWRLICVDLRGRGESAYAKDPMTYVPLTYLQDLEALLEELKIDRFVAFGTSLGGLLAMLLSATSRDRIAGALLNDIGPVVEPGGIARIRTYVGKQANWPTWLHAARGIQQGNFAVYPDYEIEQWLAMAKRLCRLTPAGRIIYDYDMKIAEPMKLPGGDGGGMDMWPAFEGLAGRPVTLIRGEHSDVLSQATAQEMAKRVPGTDLVTVPGIGHAPVLDEPECAAAIDRLLGRVLAG
ncbi:MULTISPECIES: alpha/beta fold hydrolase [Edaphosphingomonas]|uniref:Alpha/beta hydrolase n=2 Tax=Edaphosphingomonas TaxID=3423724 RepID=A0A2T4HN09_9SPHN|nr:MULTISPECIES: alpha/beta hydrolase [Sphingomonas]OHT19972.1 acyl-CoA esterase [Sphingomonas haloaromaticamans]PTD17157.1 alpha/beta hydrolase [Sphingomonas fennica]